MTSSPTPRQQPPWEGAARAWHVGPSSPLCTSHIAHVPQDMDFPWGTVDLLMASTVCHAPAHGVSCRRLCRHEFLKEMLQARADTSKESAALAGLSDTHLDGMLARTSEELAIFSQMNEPATLQDPATAECNPSKAHVILPNGAVSTGEEIPPPSKSSGGGQDPRSGPGHNANTQGPSAPTSKPNTGNLGGQAPAPLEGADAGVCPGIPVPAVGARMASHEEVRWMVEAAELAASPVAVAEDFGRGKRRRTVGTYKEPGLKDVRN